MESIIHTHTDLNEIVEEKQQDAAGHFNNSIYTNLPELIKRGMDVLDGNDKEVFLIGSLAVLSSVLPNFQTMYDGQAIESNLFMFLYGNYACGKGSLRYAKMVVAPIHKFLRESETLPEGGGQPLKRRLFIAANSSKTGIVELLAVNEGKGLIFEPEADTLTDILKQDYGNFHDLLNRCYHHENYGYYRRLNKEDIDIEKLYVSVLLSGTPAQLHKLIPSPENGLMSRFCFFRLETERSFKNVFDERKSNFEQHFNCIGEEVLGLYKELVSFSEPIGFGLTEPQRAEFMAYFAELKAELIDTFGVETAGNVHRFGVQFIRLAMILTALRNYQGEGFNRMNHCQDIDYQTTKEIMEVFIHHALNVYNSLQGNCLDKLTEVKREFYKTLPVEFHTHQALLLAAQYAISESTVKRFIDNRQLFENVRHGLYRKRK
jgi:hypothetical protein